MDTQLLMAEDGFDSRNGSVEIYVRTVLDRAIGQHIRKRRAAKRNDRGTVPLDPDGNTIVGPFRVDCDASPDLSIDLAVFLDHLSEEDRLLAQQLMTLPLTEIARLRRVPAIHAPTSGPAD